MSLSFLIQTPNISNRYFHQQQTKSPVKTTFVGANPFQELIDEYKLILDKEEQERNNPDPDYWSSWDIHTFNKYATRTKADYKILRHYITKPVSSILKYCQQNNIELTNYIRFLFIERSAIVQQMLDKMPDGRVEPAIVTQICTDLQYDNKQLYNYIWKYNKKFNRKIHIDRK